MMNENIKNGILVVLSSPSGAGKTSIAKELIEIDNNLKFSISVTTRPPRSNEKDGREYFFKTEKEFDYYIEKKQLLEHANVFGYRYGTLIDQTRNQLEKGFDLLFDVDWQGGKQLKDSYFRNQLISIFILPPSLNELESRLSNRGQDSKETIHNRMKQSFSEISHWNEYDYVLVNKSLKDTVKKLNEIISEERLNRINKRLTEKFVNKLEQEFKIIKRKNDYKI